MWKIQIIILLFMVVIPDCNADCCGCSSFWCTPPYVTSCAERCRGCTGKGSCNIFCCNCDDGCQNPKPSTFLYSKSLEMSKPLFVFKQIDTNDDNVIDYMEGYAILHRNDNATGKLLAEEDRSWFDDMDTDKDGFIQLHEFDYTLQNEN